VDQLQFFRFKKSTDGIDVRGLRADGATTVLHQLLGLVQIDRLEGVDGDKDVASERLEETNRKLSEIKVGCFFSFT